MNNKTSKEINIAQRLENGAMQFASKINLAFDAIFESQPQRIASDITCFDDLRHHVLLQWLNPRQWSAFARKEPGVGPGVKQLRSMQVLPFEHMDQCALRENTVDLPRFDINRDFKVAIDCVKM